MPERDAVIVASQRTGLAKSFRGSLNMTRPEDITAHCIKSCMDQVPELTKLPLQYGQFAKQQLDEKFFSTREGSLGGSGGIGGGCGCAK